MQIHLEPTIFSNEFSYFFVLFGPRFDATIPLIAKALEKAFGGKWKPIVVYSSKPAEAFLKENYLVINYDGDEIEAIVRGPVVALQEYEDLNDEFATSPEVWGIIGKLKKKQKKVVIIPFTTSFLEIDDPDVFVVGPDRHLAKRYDNKVTHFALFQELDLPRNRAMIFASQSDVLAAGTKILPCYITAAFSSGGSESGLIYSEKMLKKIFSRLRNVNASGAFLVSDIFEGLLLAPNVNALVTADGRTEIAVITDQILRGNRYLGNIYPSICESHHRDKIVEITIRIGDYIAKQGYRGLFGLDFLINDKGDLVVVDLNPRRQGGYSCNVLALQSIGIDLIETEVKTALGQDITLGLPRDGALFSYAWAHSKVKPSDPGQRIKNEYQKGNFENIFFSVPSDYEATFSINGSIFIDGYTGYVAMTGQDRTKLLKS
ncbi:MAG: hypothetical protein A2X09_16440 [Bacteroidetes bacterium GWF2_43_11]|nr:MAG: hypothetical protein A2X09_16440 [Bacteroidetes bacterium GWF2_43_11]